MQQPEIKIESQESLDAITIKKSTTLNEIANVISSNYEKLFTYLENHADNPLSLLVAPPFVITHKIDGQNVDIEIGLPISNDILKAVSDELSTDEAKNNNETNDINVMKTHGGESAVATHKGAYTTLSETYKQISQWLKDNNHEYGVAYEYYLNDPHEVAESELQTKVVFFLKS